MLKKILIFLKINKETQATVNIEERIAELYTSLDSENLEIVLGNDFIEYKDTILDTMINFREDLKDSTGFIFPAIHIKSNNELQENELVFKIQDKIVFHEFVIPTEKEIKKTINNSLNYAYENFLENIFTIDIAEKYINTVQIKQPFAIWNLTCMYSIVEIRNVLMKILENKKSLKNINLVFEKFFQYTLNSGFYVHYSTDKIAKEIIKSI